MFLNLLVTLVAVLVHLSEAEPLTVAETSSLIDSAVEGAEKLNLCTRAPDYEANRGTSPAFIRFMANYMKKDLKTLSTFVTSSNAVYDTLANPQCSVDEIDDCPYDASSAVVFKAVMPLVFAGLVGFFWLFVLTPIAIILKCRQRVDRLCPVSRPRGMRPGGAFLILFLFPTVFIVILILTIVGGDNRLQMSRGLDYGMCAVSELSKVAIKEISGAHANAKAVIAGLPSDSVVPGRIAAVDSKVAEIKAFLGNVTVMSASAAASNHVLAVDSVVYTAAKQIIESEVNAQPVMTQMSAFRAALQIFQMKVTALAGFVIGVNGVGAYIVDEGIVRQQDSWKYWFTWARDSSLAMFIMALIPLVFVCYIVLVILPGTQVTEYGRYFTRRVRTRGPTVAWFCTCGYTTVVLIVAAVIYWFAYFGAGSCLIADEIQTTMPALEHLVSKKFESTEQVKAFSRHFRNCIKLKAVGPTQSVMAENVFYQGTQTLEAALVEASADAVSLGSKANSLKNTHQGSSISIPAQLTNLKDALKNFASVPFITPTRLQTLKLTGEYAYNLTNLGTLTAEKYSSLYNLLAGAAPSCSPVPFTASPSNPLYANLSVAATAYGWTGSTVHGLDSFFTEAKSSGLQITTKAGQAIDTCAKLGSVVNFDDEIQPYLPFTAFLKDKWSLQKKSNFTCLTTGGALGPCNLSAFMTSLANAGTQVETLSSGLASISFSSLSTAMNALVSNLDSVSSKIGKLDDQACTYEMAEVWKHVMWATCYTGVPGFVNLGHVMFSLGMLCILASLMIFAAWRRIAINNANLPQEAPDAPNSSA